MRKKYTNNPKKYQAYARLDDEMAAALKAYADRYFYGNCSAVIRLALAEYLATRGDNGRSTRPGGSSGELPQ